MNSEYKFPRSLVGLRVHQNVKPKDIASWIGVSLSRYYYLERHSLDLSAERVIKIASGYGIDPRDVFQVILIENDIL